MASDVSPRPDISIIIPVFNEAEVIGHVLDELVQLPLDHEIVVVDDGSTDGTSDVVRQWNEVRVIQHAYNLGNGAAVKTGIRAARGSVIVMMDGDGQHKPKDIPRLLECLPIYDMVVGARSRDSETELHRDVANRFYSSIASYLVGRRVVDLTSGFRALKAPIAKRFVYLLPNGFSYPTTLTLALFRSGHTVRYVPILAKARIGRSKIKLLADGAGFLLTLARIGTLFVPLRIFLPVATSLFGTGVLYGLYLLTFHRRFSNMAVLLILAGIMLFMLGLISEQIALLRMMQAGMDHSEARE
jgi:glycosyltransferase involved in cell wall biosynthesis